MKHNLLKGKHGNTSLRTYETHTLKEEVGVREGEYLGEVWQVQKSDIPWCERLVT